MTNKERNREACKRWYQKVIKNDPDRYATYLAMRSTPKNRKATVRWREENREWVNLSRRLRSYKLTIDQYHALFEKFNFQCGICGTDTNLEVDHCHRTGKVRGILCGPHNRGIGQFNEDVTALRSAAKYCEGFNVGS